jgi:ethanolamine utilization protein EutA
MTGKGKERKPHTLADHAFGQEAAHVHAPDSDHDHDHDALGNDGPLESNPLWLQDNVVLTSVGIDIGSSGTQTIFSRLHLRRMSEDLSTRYQVVEREALFLSEVALTPYLRDGRIDAEGVGKLLDQAYAGAQLRPADIDTGAVILTGEALRRENASAIAATIAEHGGEFVCAAAGHHMEAMLAAYGSGAARVSAEQGLRLLNIDIGGGTTKLALLDRGRVLATAAIHVGGRLMVVDESGCLTRLDPAGQHHALRAGFDWQLEGHATAADLDRVAETMTESLLTALLVRPLPESVAALYLTDPILDFGPVEGVMFSGGVGEYVYGREARDFGDLGRRLGEALRRRLAAHALPWPLLRAGECIRATAFGASEYTVQLSGNTCYISNPGRLLPRRNLQVLRPDYDCRGEIGPAELASAIRAHRISFDLDRSEQDFALAFHWSGPPTHRRILRFAEGIAAGLADRTALGLPIFVMLDGDIAQTLGALLREELRIGNEILVIDGVTLRDFDYIDIGRVRLPSRTVPVTIKSLVFADDPRTGERLGHDHASNRAEHGHAHSHAHGQHDHSHEPTADKAAGRIQTRP